MNEVKELRTLDKHNADRTASHNVANDHSPRSNGIACPECGCELYDTNPNHILTSNPPQKNISCPNCDFTGYRIA